MSLTKLAPNILLWEFVAVAVNFLRSGQCSEVFVSHDEQQCTVFCGYFLYCRCDCEEFCTPQGKHIKYIAFQYTTNNTFMLMIGFFGWINKYLYRPYIRALALCCILIHSQVLSCYETGPGIIVVLSPKQVGYLLLHFTPTMRNAVNLLSVARDIIIALLSLVASPSTVVFIIK